MPYISRLKGVLRVRQIREEETYREWIKARDLLQTEEGRLYSMKEKLAATLDDMAGRQDRMAAEEMVLYFHFMRNLQKGIGDQEKVVSHQEAVCEEHRVLLDQAVKERKAVEQVEGKRKGAYLEGLKKREQAVLDEVGGRIKNAL